MRFSTRACTAIAFVYGECVCVRVSVRVCARVCGGVKAFKCVIVWPLHFYVITALTNYIKCHK